MLSGILSNTRNETSVLAWKSKNERIVEFLAERIVSPYFVLPFFRKWFVILLSSTNEKYDFETIWQKLKDNFSYSYGILKVVWRKMKKRKKNNLCGKWTIIESIRQIDNSLYYQTGKRTVVQIQIAGFVLCISSNWLLLSYCATQRDTFILALSASYGSPGIQQSKLVVYVCSVQSSEIMV